MAKVSNMAKIRDMALILAQVMAQIKAANSTTADNILARLLLIENTHLETTQMPAPCVAKKATGGMIALL